jgi:hypothetical protein
MRVREARTAFRTYSAKLPLETRIRLERKYASQGLFDFKSQTAQVLSSSIVSTDPNLLMLFLFIQVWEFAPSGQSYACTLAGHTFAECTC